MSKAKDKDWDENMYKDYPGQNQHRGIDSILQSRTPDKVSRPQTHGVVTYNLKDMSSTSQRQQSLNQIFSLIENKKQSIDNKNDDVEMEENQENAQFLNSEELLE